jgi:hypothetical protein
MSVMRTSRHNASAPQAFKKHEPGRGHQLTSARFVFFRVR